jgi:hypothetical protein
LKTISTFGCYTDKILAPPDDHLEEKIAAAKKRTNKKDKNDIGLKETTGYKYHEDDFEMNPEYADLYFKHLNFTHGHTKDNEQIPVSELFVHGDPALRAARRIAEWDKKKA